MKYFILILSFCFFTCFAFAQNSENAKNIENKTATELFNEGNYLASAQKYDEQLKIDNNNPYLYYNLANSYFKAGDTDKALVNYYRAWRLLPRDRSIRQNLIFCLQSTGQNLIPTEIPTLAFVAYYYFSLSELKGLTWFFVWLFAIVGIFFIFYNKGALRKILFICCGFILIFAIWQYIRAKHEVNLAVVITPKAELRSGPSDNFPVSITTPRAHLLEVKDKKGDWVEVSLKNEKQKYFWVLKNSIEEI